MVQDNGLKIAVVGCGWLGFPLAKHFVKQGHNVIGTTTTLSKMNELETDGIQAYLLDFSVSFAEQNIDWLKGIDILILNIPPSKLGENYAITLLNFVKLLPKQTKVVFVSSTSVYSDELDVAKEDLELEDDGHLNRSGSFVLDSEKLLNNELKSHLTILRMSGLVGGKRHPAVFMSGKSYSFGNSPVNLVHLEDCIGVVEAVITQEKWGEVFNVCSPVHPEKKDLYTAVCKDLGIPLPRFKDCTKISKIVDGSKVCKVLGYEYKFKNPFDYPLNDLT